MDGFSILISFRGLDVHRLLQTAQSGTYQAGGNPNSIAVGDFNGDKKLDLAVANTTESTVSLLLGNGDGTFQSKRNLQVSDSPWQISTADFDGEGDLDLAVAITGIGYDNTVNSC